MGCGYSFDNNLHRLDGTSVNHEDGLVGKDVVLFYFAARNCPSSKNFTPILKDFYNEVKNTFIEIIFVSWDQSEEEMMDHMRESHGDWFYYKYDKTLTAIMNQKYRVNSTPSLVVVRKIDNVTVTQHGREVVESLGAGVLDSWTQFCESYVRPPPRQIRHLH